MENKINNIVYPVYNKCNFPSQQSANSVYLGFSYVKSRSKLVLFKKILSYFEETNKHVTILQGSQALKQKSQSEWPETSLSL